MPFKSKAQVRACFAQNDPNWNCHEWAKETESIKALPEKKKQRGVENAKTAGELSNMGQNKDECFDYIASLLQNLIDKQAFVPASQAPPQANNLTQQQNQLQGQLQSDASAPIPAPTALPAAKPGVQVAPVRAPMQQSIANNTFSKMAGFGDVVKATWNSRTAKNVGDFVKQPYVWGTGAGVAATGLGSAIYNAYKSDPAAAAQAVSNMKDPASPLAPLLGIGSGLLLSRLLLGKKKKEQPRPEVRTEIVERQPPQIYVPMPQISFTPMAMPKYAYSLQGMAMRDASLSRRKKKVEKIEEPDVEALPVLPTKIEVRKRKKPIVKQAAPGDMGVSYAQPKGYGSALPGQAQRQARAQRLSDARQSRKDRNLPMYHYFDKNKPAITPAAPTAPAAAPTSMVQLAPRSQPTSPSQHVAMLAPTGSRMDYMNMNTGKQVTDVPKAAPGPVVAGGPQFGGAFGSYANKPQPAPAAPQQIAKAAPAPQPPAPAPQPPAPAPQLPAANQKTLAELDGIEARLKALQSPNQVPGTPKSPILQSGITNHLGAPRPAIATTPNSPASLLIPQNILNSQAPAQPMDLRSSFAVRPQAPAAAPTTQANPQFSSAMGIGQAVASAPNMQSGISSPAPIPAAPTSTQSSAVDPTEDELMNQLKEFRLGRPMTPSERDFESYLRADRRRRTAENTKRQDAAFNELASKIPGPAASPTMSELRDQVSQYLASSHGGSDHTAEIRPLLDNNLMARATGQAAPNMQRGVSESNASPAAAVSPDEMQQMRDMMQQNDQERFQRLKALGPAAIKKETDDRLQRLRDSMDQLNTAMGGVQRAENAGRLISSPEFYNAMIGRAPQAPPAAPQAPPAAPKSYFDLLDQSNNTSRQLDQLAPSNSFLPATPGTAGPTVNPMFATGIRG